MIISSISDLFWCVHCQHNSLTSNYREGLKTHIFRVKVSIFYMYVTICGLVVVLGGSDSAGDKGYANFFADEGRCPG